MKMKYISILLILSVALVACQSPGNQGNELPENPVVEEPTEIQTSTSLTEEVSSPQESPITEEEPTVDESPTQQEAPVTNQRTDSTCYHPYFPVSEGAFWTYQQPGDANYTLRIEEASQDSFLMTQEMDSEDIIYTVNWQCAEDGILRGTFGQMDLINASVDEEGAPDFQFETLEWEGKTLPAPELINPGYLWTSNYKLAADYDLEGFSGRMEVIVQIEHEITAIEDVVVPAGSFSDAIRVDSTGNIEMIMIMSESITTPLSNVDFNYSTWYVEGIGMVKSSESLTGYETGTELVETSFLD